MPDLTFHRLEPYDLFEIERQESQMLFLGAPGDITDDAAEILADQPCAWTAWAEGRAIACFGISETFPGVNGVAWSLLAQGLGRHHLPLTRFMQEEIRKSPLARIELIAKAQDIEWLAERYPWVDPFALVAAVMAEPTPECRWAKLLGFKPVHALRRFGAAAETYMLFERFN